MEKLLAGADGRLAVFSERNGKNAREVMRKAQAELCSIMKCFNPWKMQARLEQKMRVFTAKTDGKRNQLQSVQLMFRNFAQQLEANLKEATPRDPAQLLLHQKRKMSKSEQTVSLPDIHKRPSS